MKKKIIPFTLFLLILAFNFVLAAEKKKVAVCTFYVDKHIDFSQLKNQIGAAAAIASLAENPNFDLKPVLEDFHKIFFEQYAEQFPFELLPEEEVINDPKYMEYESATGETKDEDRRKLFQRFITIDGYKALSEFLLQKSANKNQNQMLEIFGDKVDGVMFVYLSYEFVEKLAVGGMGTAGMKGFVHIKLWNKEGKRVFSINEYGTSKKSVALVAGVPVTKPDQIQPLCYSATDKIMKDLNKRLKKIAAKSAKKL